MADTGGAYEYSIILFDNLHAVFYFYYYIILSA